MKITMLGTGNALVTECYNTCFVIEDNKEYFMVDGGGGNTVLSNLKSAGIDWMDIRHIFVTHKHIDHILGIIWMIRLITQNMGSGKYPGEAFIYGHSEVIELLTDMSVKLLQKKQWDFIGKRLHLIEVRDGEKKSIIGGEFTFFDIGSTKAKQYGFSMEYKGGKLTCCGDEPYNPICKQYVDGSDWLMHEAFCLYSEADMFKPYEKNHSTVKDACELASELGVKNVILYHTEDKNITDRKSKYVEEGQKYFSGNILVPDDLEVISL
ncbi:MAG: MBL fold metallo-hydrolase [Lachnospiraceae bacterium]|nr:MBL fold metallo-hydrolase [Lachnospiraceae bacterium]